MHHNVFTELKEHVPFTLFGAFTGILLMLGFLHVRYDTAYAVFYVLHPFHVFLSALVTAAMYKNYQCGGNASRCDPLVLLVVGYIGSVGIATLSDSVVPYIGEVLLGLPNKGIHIGFIEKWWLVNPLALAGILLAYFRSSTKFPHAAHVLISTWASLFHILMALGTTVNIFMCAAIGVFLFLAVWIPCCVSDIVFPMLFVHDVREP